MPIELTTEEKAALVESLTSDFGIPEEAAEACLVAAGWELEAAKKVANLSRVQHLLVSIRFLGRNPLPHGGLISILLARGATEPEHIIGLTIDGYEYIEEISPHFPASDFIKAILYPPKRNRGDSTWLSVKQSIILSLTPEAVEELFSNGGGETIAEVSDEGTLLEHNPLKDAISELIKHHLDELFMESIKIEIAAEFLNGFQHDNLKLLLSDETVEKDEDPEEKKPKPHLPDVAFKVQLRGRLIIDPHQGVPVEDLQVGDTIICDIIDISSIATEVGKMLGAYKRGIWFPINGRIISLKEGLSGTKRIILVAGRGIYIVTSALNSVRIKVSEKEIDSILRRIEHQQEESVRSVLGMLPLALIILGIALALTILLQRG